MSQLYIIIFYFKWYRQVVNIMNVVILHQNTWCKAVTSCHYYHAKSCEYRAGTERQVFQVHNLARARVCNEQGGVRTTRPYEVTLLP